jgi:DNA-binding NarL/FixJ family response regulator
MDRILIADDHPMVRGALAFAIEAAFGRAEILEASNLDELTAHLGRLGIADLVLLDLLIPGAHGFSGLLKLRSDFPETPVLVISALEDPKLVDVAIALGAAGFIPKSTPRSEIVAALGKVAAGGVYVPTKLRGTAPEGASVSASEVETAQKLATLTAQQLRVLHLLGKGKLNKEIAYELNIAEPTVKVHVSAILQKLGVYSRTQAVVLAGRLLSEDLLAPQALGDGVLPEKLSHQRA